MGGLPAVLVGAQVSPVDGDGGRIADRAGGSGLSLRVPAVMGEDGTAPPAASTSPHRNG